MRFLILAILVSFSLIQFNCSTPSKIAFKPKEIYKSPSLIITQVAAHSYVHTTYLQTNDFGNVPCNGLIVSSNNEAIIFDTPTSNDGSKELLNWIAAELKCKVKAIVPTHFHNDCLAGLQFFEENKIPSHAYFKTIELAKENKYSIPQNSFTDSLILTLGAEPVIIKYFGEGHTKDNVVGYFQADNILFGGCLIKELNATKGYTGDANLADWSSTVSKIKAAYPLLKTVVPGHGKEGNSKLLDYTIKLFEPK